MLNKKFKKAIVILMAAVLVGTAVPDNAIQKNNEVTAASVAISQIPGTVRTFSSYNDNFMSVTGFAAGGIQDRSKYVNTSYHVKVSTERAFLNAILAAQSGTVKLIEVQNNLNLGYLELGLSSSEVTKYSFVSKYGNPTYGFTNPVMQTSGVSKLNISNTNGLTIFSTNGSTINHVEFKLQSSSSDIVFRNLSFDGMYQFDDTGLHKEVGWTFIKINGANDVWIDHCSFAIAADGMLDIENGSSGVTLSWCKFGLEASENPGTSSAIYQSVTYMEQKYNSGSLSSTSRYYKLRKAGATKSQIMAYEAFHSKCHLVGSGDKDYVNYVDSNGKVTLDGNQRLELTMAYCYYINLGQRMPMIRQGKGHLVNCYFDNSSHLTLHYGNSAFTQYGAYNISRGIDARNGASIGADTCVYNYVDSPIIGSEMQGDDTGSMSAPWDTLFANAYNHSLIVNSQVTTRSGSTYTGSSWDNNGSNLFTSGFTWHDKSTIGKWAWSSSIVGSQNMSKSNPPSTAFSFTYGYSESLPYSYYALPLNEVKSVIKSKAGASKISLTAAKWAAISYGTTTTVTPTPVVTPAPSAATVEEGLYMIKNVNSGLYMDVAGGTAANSTNVQQWGAS
ncbi:pectate lyase family protein, partial [Anaeromicropila populeti]